MVRITVDVKDAQVVGYHLQGLGKALPSRINDGLRKSMVHWHRVASQLAPVGMLRGGTLRQKLSFIVMHLWAAMTGGTEYTRIQEFGGKTKPHDIKLRFAKAFAWPTRGGHGAFSNAAKIGKGKKFYRIGSARLSSASLAGKSITGMTVVRGSKGTPGIIKHPGSNIRPKHFVRRAYEKSKDYILKVMTDAASPARKSGGAR